MTCSDAIVLVPGSRSTRRIEHVFELARRLGGSSRLAAGEWLEIADDERRFSFAPVPCAPEHPAPRPRDRVLVECVRRFG
jgi:hypothetical protein